MDRYKKGYTLMELVIVLSLFLIIATVSFSSMTYLRVSGNYERKVVQYAVDDAMVGYFGLMGTYPYPASQIGQSDHILQESEIKAITDKLTMYVGYTFGQKYDIDTLMRRYQFVVSYPNKYIFKIKVIQKQPGHT